MFKKFFVVMLTALVLMGLALPVSAAYAAPANTTTVLRKVAGKVYAVNPIKRTITVKSYLTGKLVTVKAVRTTVIQRNGRVVGFGRLQVGDKFAANYYSGTMVATSETAQETPDSHAEVYGTISAVDSTAGTVTITPDNGAAAVTLSVDGSTDLKRNDAAAVLADFVVGDNAEAHYDLNTELASEIHASSNEDDGNNDSADAYGLVTAIDATAGTMTILPMDGSAAITFTTNANTQITRNDSPATLSNFVVGDAVEVEYDSATLLALQIDGQ